MSGGGGIVTPSSGGGRCVASKTTHPLAVTATTKASARDIEALLAESQQAAGQRATAEFRVWGGAVGSVSPGRGGSIGAAGPGSSRRRRSNRRDERLYGWLAP